MGCITHWIIRGCWTRPRTPSLARSETASRPSRARPLPQRVNCLAVLRSTCGSGRAREESDPALIYARPTAAQRRRLNFNRTRNRRCSSGPSASPGTHWLCPNHRPARSKRNTTSPGKARLSRHKRTDCHPQARLSTCQPRTSRRRPTTAWSWVSRIRRGMAQPAWAVQAVTTEKANHPGSGLAHTASHAST